MTNLTDWLTQARDRGDLLMLKLYYAARTGWTDGVDQPFSFSVGMTYEQPARQRIYDLASVWGQRYARVHEAWPHPEP